MDQDTQATARPVQQRHRPQSRASTASVQSATTQPSMDQSKSAGTPDPFAQQWHSQDHVNSKGMGSVQQLPADVFMLQAATQMQNPGQEFVMDDSMSVHMGNHMSYQQPHQHHAHQQHNGGRHPLPAEQLAQNASFNEGDSQMADSQMVDADDDDSMAAIVGAPKPNASRSSANNELEMRQLFGANRHRKLQEVAGELHGDERGPNSERTRQVFAMLWINQVCSNGRGSVPRGRVYANYASRCATERITVLNPASFGKLVRVLFPGLKTRRLGVRGESKYHYVNFALVDDQPELAESQAQRPRPLPHGPSQSFSAASRKSSSTPARAINPSPQLANDAPTAPARGNSGAPSYSIYNITNITSVDNIQSTLHKTPIELSFMSALDQSFDHSGPIALPPIESYLPPGTDADAAKSLSAVYRSHCTSLIECIRFCREKTFFHLYTSFQGTLTMPVQKLFAKPELAAWIEGCDLVLYQRMMTIVSSLILQVLPKPVMVTLRAISDRLVPHIRDSFQGQPQHVIDAKEAPAVLFANLLDRAMRTNLAAHAAANMLASEANRDQMYMDWIMTIRPRRLAESVPTRAMDEVVSFLLTGIRDLLNPINVPWEIECLTIYGEAFSNDPNRRSDSGREESDSAMLDGWVTMLRELPERYPYASHTDIALCVERLGTALMRDLTIGQNKSFGSWWIIKVWVDEMVTYLVEEGGFMKLKRVLDRNAAPSTRSEPAVKAVEREQSSDTAGEHLNMPAAASQPQPGRAPFPPPNNAGQTTKEMSGGELHDDSGIGIRTPEEEFAMDKYPFAGGENPNVMGDRNIDL